MERKESMGQIRNRWKGVRVCVCVRVCMNRRCKCISYRTKTFADNKKILSFFFYSFSLLSTFNQVPLHSAALEGSVGCVDALIQYGAYIEAKDVRSKRVCVCTSYEMKRCMEICFICWWMFAFMWGCEIYRVRYDLTITLLFLLIFHSLFVNNEFC